MIIKNTWTLEMTPPASFSSFFIVTVGEKSLNLQLGKRALMGKQTSEEPAE